MLATLTSRRKLLLLLAAVFIVCEMLLASQQRTFSPTSQMADGLDRVRQWVNLGEDEDDNDKAVGDAEEKQGEAKKGAGGQKDAATKQLDFRDMLYPAEAKVRAFNMYDEDYGDQERVEAILRAAEGAKRP